MMVSSRHTGRVSGGMATEMARRARVLDGEPYLLPEAAHWRALVLRRNAAAAGVPPRRTGPGGACARLGLGAAELAALGDCPNDIAFVERADPILESRSPPARTCPLDRALADLDALALSLRDAA
ncbi:hypothetical protein [Methylobacterium sp. WL1]|uniref:hypothetical protein n=1 Tax=Methylobacterium sp. WL1 TaxID=2603276 RepID=UPI001FF02DD7|nr:hypothetical protein [Methylobacterium sp. WL1]